MHFVMPVRAPVVQRHRAQVAAQVQPHVNAAVQAIVRSLRALSERRRKKMGLDHTWRSRIRPVWCSLMRKQPCRSIRRCSPSPRGGEEGEELVLQKTGSPGPRLTIGSRTKGRVYSTYSSSSYMMLPHRAVFATM